MKKLINVLPVFLVLLMSLFSIIPFFSPGFYSMHDDTQVSRIFEMEKSLLDGQFPVRWVNDLGYGYGYPIFNFYSPFPYYAGGLIILLGINSLLATKTVFAAGILISGMFMYLFVKSFLGKSAGFVSAIIYVYFPYHAVNIYVRGALDELYGYAFLPLFFWGMYKIYYLSRVKSYGKIYLKYIIISSLGLGLIIISHNLTALMLSVFGLLFIPGAIIFSRYKKKILQSYLLLLLLGFLLSAFYSIPALAEMKYTNVLSQVEGGANFSNNFVCPLQLWDSPWGFGGSIKGCIDGMSFRIGKILIILALLSLIIYMYQTIRKKALNKFFIWSSFIFLIMSIFLTLDMSIFFWDIFPFMAFLQYPWRFLEFSGFFISIICGCLILEIQSMINKKTAIVLAIIVTLSVIFLNLKLFKPQSTYIFESNYYTNTSYINWRVSKISDEYMPKNYLKPNNQNQIPKQKFEIIRGSADINLLISKTSFLKTIINTNENAILKINIAYFPGWEVSLNGTSVSFLVENNGLYLTIPKGTNTIEVKLHQTPIERLSNLISLIGIFVLFLAIIFYINYPKYVKKTS